MLTSFDTFGILSRAQKIKIFIDKQKSIFINSPEFFESFLGLQFHKY